VETKEKEPDIPQLPDTDLEPIKEPESVSDEKVEEMEVDNFAEPVLPAPAQPTPRKVGRPKLNKGLGSAKKEATPTKIKKEVTPTILPEDDTVNLEVSEQSTAKLPVQPMADIDDIDLPNKPLLVRINIKFRLSHAKMIVCFSKGLSNYYQRTPG